MELDIEIIQGKTFEKVLRWETEPFLFTAILGMSNTAPVRITTGVHGIPDGWRVAVVDAAGMTELNAASNPPKSADFRRATVVDTTHIEFNPISAGNYGTWTSGGYLQWYTPHDLTGYTARMAVKDKVGGTELLALTTANNRITIDDSAKKIDLKISATDTAARILASELTVQLGQTIVVENRPGGGFTIGLDMVAKAPPDGYTIGLGPVGAMAISPNKI